MLSPLDDRYFDHVMGLDKFFSEKALWRYRLKVELEYLKFLLFERDSFYSWERNVHLSTSVLPLKM